MRLRLIAVVLLAGLAATGARAADRKIDCASKELLEAELTACSYQAFQKQDRELNALYAQLSKREDPQTMKQLQAAQRAWLQFRDLECTYELQDAGGTLETMERYDCEAALTSSRSVDLKRVLHQRFH